MRVATQAHERQKLERICRYIARPAVSEHRLALTQGGKVRYELKTPFRDGTTHIIFEPLDFMYRMYGMPRAHGYAGTAIACIEDPMVIEKILSHLKNKTETQETQTVPLLPPARAPPAFTLIEEGRLE